MRILLVDDEDLQLRCIGNNTICSVFLYLNYLFCATFFRIIRIISEKWEQNGSTEFYMYPVLFV